MRITPNDLAAKKAAGEKIAMITVYDYPSARIAERAGAPVLLVGDSLGMVVLGHETTIPVTLDDMIRHAAAVVRGRTSSLVVCDLPFLTYASEADAVVAARRVMQETGAEAVKLEGGAAIVPIVKRLVELGVPVMGHLGFTPQSQHTLGVKVQAKDDAGAQRLIEDALALEAAAKGITVNAIAPGYISTDMVAAVAPKILAGIVAQIPVGRLGHDSEIAQIVRFLADDGAAFITGSTITANGGQYMI